MLFIRLHFFKFKTLSKRPTAPLCFSFILMASCSRAAQALTPLLFFVFALLQFYFTPVYISQAVIYFVSSP